MLFPLNIPSSYVTLSHLLNQTVLHRCGRYHHKVASNRDDSVNL